MRVLYDGWPLIHNPLSPQALHLLAILAYLPEEISPIVAIPQTLPAWMGDIQTHIYPIPGSRLRWEQIHLPIIARQFRLLFPRTIGPRSTH